MKRREVLQIGASAAALHLLRPLRSWSAISPNEKILVACIGIGGMGRSNLRDFLAHDDCEVVALCDVDRNHLTETQAEVKEKTGKSPDVYADFREVLARTDIDAVMIGTPDHWHCPIAALACQAGKDVYVEKPLGHNIHEARLAVDAARRGGRITQMGTQVHQTETYRRAVELVKTGKLGEVSKVRIWIANNNAPEGLGNPADADPPEHLDYNFWLGSAPDRPYNEKRSHFNWRYFWDYGGGWLGDMGCHILDPVFWALDLDAPTRVSSVGGRYVTRDLAEVPDTQEALWEFPAQPGRDHPLQLVWSLTTGNGRGLEGSGKGILICGTEGTLNVDYGFFKHFDKGGELVEEFRPEDDGLGAAGKSHKREFLDGMRTRTRCSCDIEYGHKLTTVLHLGNIAHRTGRVLHWDAEREEFAGDPDASRLVGREHRQGWSPEELGLKTGDAAPASDAAFKEPHSYAERFPISQRGQG